MRGQPLYKDVVEVSIPANMLFAIAIADVFVTTDDVEDPARLARLRSLAKLACLEPLERFPPNIRKIVGAHIHRVTAMVTEDLDQQPGQKVAATVWFFLKEITDSGYLELYEGSPVAEAAALFLPMFEDAFEVEKLIESAQKQARRVLKKLQERGYYV